ncbi:MAG: phosphoribosylglycinamide formyltransferase [Acidobacteriota bacterium]
MENRKIGILISGRGSNMLALLDAIDTGRLQAEVGVIISNRADAGGIELARARNCDVLVIPHQGLTRAAHEKLIIDELKRREIALICLAGYMRLLSREFIEAFPNSILNIHPSLLPAFPGIDAQRQAIEYGVKLSGCTVHFVNEDCDGGPIILQSAVPVYDEDDADTLAARILVEEHKIYTQAVQLVLDGNFIITGRSVVCQSVAKEAKREHS